MNNSSTVSNRLFWKISSTLLLLLLILGVVYVTITGYTAQRYLGEANQKLFGEIASHTVKEVKPNVDNGIVDTAAIKDIMHSMMVINPSVEVYLLDTLGGIITYVAPKKKIKLDRVDLAPIKDFINDDYQSCISGDDPRSKDRKKIFSAAPIIEDGQTKGYVYIILASEDHDSAYALLSNSYILQLGTNYFLVTLLGALLIGLLAIWFLTRNLRNIIDTVRRFKDGDYKARIENADQGDLKLLSVTFNEMADQINDNIDKIQSVEKLRRELIANVSHDLRTPLSIMQGYVETMMMKEDSLKPEDRKRYLGIVLKSSERLGRLITQLFEYSKLEAKEITPIKEPFFISELAQDVLAKYEVLAKEKDITIHLEKPELVPLVFADVSLVERVIQNLMDNALKFTPKGGKISIQLKPLKETVEVLITDNGPGIPLQEQPFIFERLHQAKDADKKESGAGLGLAIAKKIMDIHDSTIRVISKPNEGASFIFNLPAHTT